LFTESLAPYPTAVNWGRFRVSPHPAVGVQLQFAVYAFQCCGEDSIFPGAVLEYVPQGVGRGVTCSVCCSPALSAGLFKQLWKQLVGSDVPLFSLRCVGRGAFHGLGGSGCHRAPFWLMLCVLFIDRRKRKKNKKEKRPRGFSRLLDAIKGYFKDQSLNFMCA
jgi:hypothetical protein